jgi:hypothetical protein
MEVVVARVIVVDQMGRVSAQRLVNPDTHLESLRCHITSDGAEGYTVDIR